MKLHPITKYFETSFAFSLRFFTTCETEPCNCHQNLNVRVVFQKMRGYKANQMHEIKTRKSYKSARKLKKKLNLLNY